MSHSIIKTNDGYDIFLTRGDTLFLQINLTKNQEPYQPVDGERVRFAVKKRYKDPDEMVLINKDVPLDTLLLELVPGDTKSLKMDTDYVFDIEYTDVFGHVDTFIKGIFHLNNEVI